MVSRVVAPDEVLETSYLEAHVDAIARCARISDLLFDLPSPDGEVPITWGHVTDLGEINRRVQMVVEFLERPTT